MWKFKRKFKWKLKYSEVSNCRGGWYKRGGLAISKN